MKLYEDIAKHLDISVEEVRERSTKEPIVHLYYMWKYNWTPGKTDVPF